MTQAELTYFTRTPQLLAELVSELKKMNEKLANVEKKLEEKDGGA